MFKKLTLKNSFYVLIAFFNLSIFAQEKYSVSVFPSRLNISFENVEMQTEEDLGFLGLGYEVLEISSKFKSLYVGLHSYSAITGERPGLITLGMTAGLRFPLLKKNNFYIDGGFFVGGGGGGGAADGGGLIIRPHIALEKQFSFVGLRVGYSQINFPTGEINGNQINFGVTFNNQTYLNNDTLISENGFSNYNFKNLRFGLVGTSYFNLSEASSSRLNREEQSVGLLGAQLEYSFNDFWYSLAKINGALIGDADGYMSILLGLGIEYPLLKENLKLESRVLFGPTGGGGIESGGGATLQYEIGPSYHFKNDFYIKAMLGKTQSPWGDLNTQHAEIVLGKNLGRIHSNASLEENQFAIEKSKVNKNHMTFGVYNRTYFSPSDVADKNNLPYKPTFNLLCFEGEQFLGEKFSLNAATVWAYEGDYGAYAEGLVGAAYKFPFTDKLSVKPKLLFGAAGGGGIDLGSGLIFQYTAGLSYNLTKNSALFVNAGKFQPLSGNFNPFLLDFGVKLHLYQLFKRK